jgi:hypothetical protein
MAVRADLFPNQTRSPMAAASQNVQIILGPVSECDVCPREHSYNSAVAVQNGSVANTVFHSEWLHRLSIAHVDARRSLRKAPIPSSKPPPLRPRKPPQPSSTFVGREAILADMKRALCNPNPSPRAAVYVLSGVGGAGKTQIMSKFSQDEGSW